MTLSKYSAATLIGLGLWFTAQNSYADGLAVDKVYHPYVQPLEKEVEYRVLDVNEQDHDLDRQLHKLGVGLSPIESWFMELYVIGEQAQDRSLTIEAYEVEAKWQLTEQGEFALDWAAIFELEKNRADNQWEWSAGIIAAKEWGQFTGTGNLMMAYEWGDNLKSELEFKGAMQLKYRWMPWCEPGVEFYANDQHDALGPVLLGQIKLAPGHSLFWQAGWHKIVRGDAPQSVARVSLEYEFF